MMSIVKMPSPHDYWAAETTYAKIADIMSHNRFEQIKHFIHCNNNLEAPQPLTDVLYNVRPIITHLQNIFKSFKPKEFICIDEQVVLFKGRLCIKQYNPNKPKKWGYKLYVLCDDEGFVHNFEVHIRKIAVCPNQPDIGAFENIVLTLLQNVERQNGHKVFTDNWYTGIPLALSLAKEGMLLTGTIRPNRLSNCKMASNKELKDQGQGSYEMKEVSVDSVKLLAIKWIDNQSVTVLSLFDSVEPMKTVKRYDTKEKKFIEVQFLAAIANYNKHMGGVDLLDAFLSYY